MNHRAILTIRTIEMQHYDDNELKYIDNEYNKSVPLPNDLYDMYDDGDMLPLDSFSQYNDISKSKIVSYCTKIHNNDTSDYYKNQVKKCFYVYKFVVKAVYKIPKYTKMQLTFDNVGAYHDGYCSDSECEYKIETNALTRVEDIPDEMLGLYDEEEIPITNKMKKQYNFNKGYSYGSGYCRMKDTNDDRLKEISECNLEYYILNNILLTN